MAFLSAVLLFQFLMVRLKECSIQLRRTNSLVSIPYGSIKSSVAVNYSIFWVVSIPYGSIKRKKETLSPSAIRVSIPYGSIKSKKQPPKP